MSSFKPIYLDYAAATPMDSTVIAAMEPYLSRQFYNPSATYLAAKQVSKDLEVARSSIAGWLGARSSELIFVAGGTEANNLAIQGVMRQYPNGNIVISAVEHPAVLEPALQYECKLSPVDQNGLISIPTLEKVINDSTVLVSVMYANNEIGTVQPVRRIAQLLQSIRKKRQAAGNDLPIYFHTDACQAAGYLDLHVARLGVDMLTINAGKIYGPKQCGALYASAGLQLAPQILGGGQERGFRSGTENTANIIGFAVAMDLVQSQRVEESLRLRRLQELFIELLEKYLPTAKVNGSVKYRLPNNVHITVPGSDNERLIMEMDEVGIMCAAGSACSASSEEASQVLAAIGLSQQTARSSLRFTMGRQTTEEDIRRTVAQLSKLV